MTELSAIEKVKKANALIMILDNEDVQQQFSTLPDGEFAYTVFKEAVEAKVSGLIASGVPAQEVAQANHDIAEMVQNIKQLQDSLVDLVQRAMSNQQEGVARRGRSRNAIIPEDSQVDSEPRMEIFVPGDTQPIMF